MKVIQRRGDLICTQKAIKNGKLTIGFIGGSITDGRTNWNWPDPVCSWFYETFPNTKFFIENAAIGGTGSDLATMRVEKEIINRECDLVFVEYAVNDWGFETEYRMKTREGLLRKLLQKEQRDIVLVYTYGQYMYPFMIKNQMPPSISEFEEIACHYNLSSVWMSLHALNQVKQGKLKFEEWLPDNLHPQYRGSLVYAESVITFLKKALIGKPTNNKTPFGKKLPKSLNENNWQGLYLKPFSEIKRTGYWLVKRWNKLAFIDQTLWTTAIGAKLSFGFEGRGLILGFDFGKASSEFVYRIDKGEWRESKRERYDWCDQDGWYTPYFIADDLPKGKHFFELEVIHGNHEGKMELNTKYSGTNFCLGSIGIIP